MTSKDLKDGNPSENIMDIDSAEMKDYDYVLCGPNQNIHVIKIPHTQF